MASNEDHLSLSCKSGTNKFVVHGYYVSKVFLYQILSIFLTLITLVLLVCLLTSLSKNCNNMSHNKTCETNACIEQAAEILKYMNKSADPCDNFYNYACGQFYQMHPPVSNERYGVEDLLLDRNERRLDDFLFRDQSHNDSSAVSKARTLYITCLKARDSQENYVKDIKDFINGYGGMELFGTWNSTNWNFSHIFRNILLKYRVKVLVKLFFSFDSDLLLLEPLKPVFHERIDSFVKRPSNIFLQRYKQSIQEILRLLEADASGSKNGTNRTCNDTCIEGIANDIVDVDAKLYEITFLYQSSAQKDMSIQHNSRVKVSLSELEKLFDQINWRALMVDLYGHPTDPNTKHFFLVLSKDFLVKLNNLIKTTKVKKMHNYLMWAIIKAYLPALGRRYHILTEIINYESPEINVKYCNSLLSGLMLPAVSAIVVYEQSGNKKLEAMKEFEKELKSKFQNSLKWMSNTSMKKSLEKLDNVTIKYGYSDWVANETQLNEHYKKLSLHPNNFLKNILAVHEFYTIENRLKAKEKYDDFLDSLHDLNLPIHSKVIFNSATSEIVVGFGALQIPWYNPKGPSYINVAGIGSVLYKVLAEIILELYEESDKDYSDNVTAEMFQSFKQCAKETFDYKDKISKAERIIRQLYPKMFRFFTTSQAVKIESFYFAYKMIKEFFYSVTDTGNNDAKLPGTEHSSVEQTFYLLYAQSHCETKPLSNLTINDFFEKRLDKGKIVNNIVYNDKDFRRVYKCKNVPKEFQKKSCVF